MAGPDDIFDVRNELHEINTPLGESLALDKAAKEILERFENVEEVRENSAFFPIEDDKEHRWEVGNLKKDEKMITFAYEVLEAHRSSADNDRLTLPENEDEPDNTGRDTITLADLEVNHWLDQDPLAKLKHAVILNEFKHQYRNQEFKRELNAYQEQLNNRKRELDNPAQEQGPSRKHRRNA